MTARSATDAPAVESAVRQVLSKAHAVHPDDDEAVGSFNTAQEFGRVMSLFTGLRFFVWLVGTLTLLAGALGVSNIMLIVVKERTREFGIRKALGATPASLISLVVQEAATLTTLAGYAGIVVAVAFLELSARFVSGSNKVLGSPEVDFQVTLLATGVLIVTGIIAGIVPARHAARINPVEALRSE
jgi:putative ABC transport system permease protein